MLVPQIESLGTLTMGTDKESLLSGLLYTRNEEWSGDAEQFAYIPMWGETPEVTITDNNPALSTKLLRMAARVDVYLGEDIKDLTLKGLEVYWANSRGYILPDPSHLIYENGENSYKVQAPTLPSNPMPLPTPLTFPADSSTDALPSVYLFEAEAGTTYEDATCLIIKAVYGSDTDATYYRLDFVSLKEDGTLDAYKPVLRNHRYVFNITRVDGRGYSTVEEALNSEGYNLGVKLYEWDQGEISHFAFNSQYVLGVSQLKFNLNKPGSVNELLVTTDYPAGWKATVDSSLYPWLTVVSSVFTGANNKDPLVFRTGDNDSGQIRTGYIHVTAGTLEFIITVIQDVEDQLYLTVTDAQGIAIKELLFVRYPDSNTPVAREVNVTWAPATTSVAVSHTNHLPIGFDYGSGDNISLLSTLTGGSHQFTILPPAFTESEIANNPFLEKASTARFTLQEGTESVTESLELRQVSYDLVADLEDIYYMDGSVQGMKVRSNVSWTAQFRTNVVVNELIDTSGGNNTTGELVTFRMVADPNKLIGTGTATIVFECTTEHGDTFTKEYTIDATSADPPIVGANTYLVKPGGNQVAIPINWANKDGVKRILPTDEVEVEFVWTDVKAGMSSSGAVQKLEIDKLGVNRELVVTSGSAVGNAVVGVKVNENLAWSWLIWVTDYDPNNGGRTYSANGFTVMDRNLGASTDQVDTYQAHGLYFQWARKDPFIYPTVLEYVVGAPKLSDYPVYLTNDTSVYTTVEATSLGDNLEAGIRNPLTFYTGSRPIANSYLWKQSDGSKGAQDPCPEGWRLPPNDTNRSLWLNVTRTFNPDDTYVTLSGLGNWQLSGYLINSGGEMVYSMTSVYM
ncbi:MAG: BACON domain-containing protein [Bacteroides sp.]|nr:BACON domain-containing protein [Bacteroides sp.]